MSLAGDSTDWRIGLFPGGLVPKIIDLVLDAWAGCPKPEGNELEPKMTQRLCACVKRHRTARGLPINVHLESSETDATGDKITGRMDIRVIRHGDYEDIYFAFEAKKLSVVSAAGRWDSQAGAYVDDGMMRFVTGQYAAGLDKGGMLGYVMDGQVTKAIRAVDCAVRKRREDLRMHKSKGLQPSTARPSNANAKETTHKIRTHDFVIHHLFLAAL